MRLSKYCCILMLLVTGSLQIKAQKKDIQDRVKGWTLLSDNKEEAIKAIDHAAAYGINHLQLSHDIVHDLRHIKEERRRILVNELTSYAHAKNIRKVLVWDHALYNLDYYPKRFRTAPGGKINLDDPAFWEWFKNDYREMLRLVPGIQGIVLSFIETGARAEEQYSQKMTTSAAKLAAVVNAIAEVVISERKLELYARTFSYSKEEYDRITGAIELFHHPEIRLMMKETPHDFFLTHPNDFFAGKINRPTIIEFDAAGEFNGQGVIANTWPEYMMKRWTDFRHRPNVIGYTARLDRYGNTSLIGQPGEINLFTLKKIDDDQTVSPEQVYKEFIEKNYGKAAYPYLRKAFGNAFDIISSILYTLGTNTANHSSLHYHSYPSSYIRHVSGKWLDPPVVMVKHNVNRSFHYWKELVNHLAPPGIKNGHQQFREIPEVVKAGWVQPQEMMNEEYLRYVIREKEFGVEKAQESVRETDHARPYLSETQYAQLSGYFKRTLMTAKLHKAVASLYFSWRVHARGEAYRTSFVRETLYRSLDEVKTAADKISNWQEPVPQGEWKWINDPVKAMSYYEEVKAYLEKIPGKDREQFAHPGYKNAMKQSNYGIANGNITARMHYENIGGLSGIFAPPFASSDFSLDLRVFGEIVPTKEYRWYPYELYRSGEINGISLSTETVLVPGSQKLILKINLRNYTGENQDVPIQLQITGGFGYVKRWDFLRPDAKGKTTNEVKGNYMKRINEDGCLSISTSLPEPVWFDPGSMWQSRISLAPGASGDYHVLIELGRNPTDPQLSRKHLENAEQLIGEARAAYAKETDELLQRLPKLTASNKELEAYYYRSMAVLFTNKWKVPEFVLQPYFGSGGVIGGSVTLHLWEFGLPAQLFPLFDSASSRNHIRQFLKVDITRRSRFEPMSGEGAGSWYQVNQDKIIELIYYYVLHTGDRAFLQEKVEGKTILEHVLDNALFGDDLKKPVTLVDYGPEGEHHLELRRGYPYQGIMPDLNALRYQSYLRAWELSGLAGKPMKLLIQRAEQLKQLLKKELWSEKDRWFWFEINKKRDLRFTNFMYTLIGTGVFDPELEKGLMLHLNEPEFLGAYGMHSISKLDPAYDQVDFDHGGGGSYVAFPPLICQQFYKAGYKAEADDLFQRHLWWGAHLPYWGDSKAANFKGYREDTPLQSDFSALAGAQAVLFGLFGISVSAEGTILINPVSPSFSPELKLEGLKLRGKTIDIISNGLEYTVVTNGTTYKRKIGESVTIPAN